MENDAQEPQENEAANPARTGFPPFEAVPSVSALDKEEDASKEEAGQDLDAPDIEALMKLAESEAIDETVSDEQIVEDEVPSATQQVVEDKPVEFNQEKEVETVNSFIKKKFHND